MLNHSQSPSSVAPPVTITPKKKWVLVAVVTPNRSNSPHNTSAQSTSTSPSLAINRTDTTHTFRASSFARMPAKQVIPAPSPTRSMSKQQTKGPVSTTGEATASLGNVARMHTSHQIKTRLHLLRTTTTTTFSQAKSTTYHRK